MPSSEGDGIGNHKSHNRAWSPVRLSPTCQIIFHWGLKKWNVTNRSASQCPWFLFIPCNWLVWFWYFDRIILVWFNKNVKSVAVARYNFMLFVVSLLKWSNLASKSQFERIATGSPLYERQRESELQCSKGSGRSWSQLLCFLAT